MTSRSTEKRRLPGAPILAIVGGAGLPLVLAYSGANTVLGAHPWWSVSVAWIGMPIGLALAALVLWFGAARKLAIGVVLVLGVCAALAAHFGVLEFSASYAENRLAGKAWYFGWIGVMAALSALVVMVLWPRRQPGPTATPR